MSDTSNRFAITLKRVEFEPELFDDEGKQRHTRHDYLVTFIVLETRSDPIRRFEFPVWVRGRQVRPEDVVQTAKHQLHQDLESLAKQTAPSSS